MVIKYYNGYGDNLRIKWDNEDELEKVSSSEYEWKKVINPDEVWETTWEEEYRRWFEPKIQYFLHILPIINYQIFPSNDA